jgi:EpsI family protein
MERARFHFAAVVGLITLTFLYVSYGMPEDTPDLSVNPTAAQFLEGIPYSLEGWTGRDVAVDEHAFTILSKDADGWLVREYRRGEDRIILSLVTTVDQRKLFRVHIPDICLPAQGWMVMERSGQTVQLAPGRSLLGTSLLAEKGGLKSQVLYWFTSGNRFIESKILHRLLLVWDGVIGERTPGTLIEITAPLGGKDRKQVFQVQEGFAQLLVPFLPVMGSSSPA